MTRVLRLVPIVDQCRYCKHEWIRRRPKAAKVCSKCKRIKWQVTK